MIVPEHLQIEVVAGLCSAHCSMCTIDNISRKGIMSNEEFTVMLERFKPYADQIRHLSLFLMGEPLLDKRIADKVRIAREMGFRGIGFATNGSHLSEDMGRRLLEAGLDTIIFSIDGIKKETHEQIRPGINFDSITRNVLKFIEMRNESGHTKVIVRMVKQESNIEEWEPYREYWEGKLNSKFGDQVSSFEIHNWAKDDADSQKRFQRLDEYSKANKIVCSDLTERMVVLLNGDVTLCCVDEKGSHDLGNVLEEDPISLYNGPTFQRYRKLMETGNLTKIDFCKNCQVILSRMERQFVEV